MMSIELPPPQTLFSQIQNPNNNPIPKNPFQNPNCNPRNNAITQKQFSHQPNTPFSDRNLLFREKFLYLQNLNVNPQKAFRKNPNLRSCPLSTLKSVQHCLSSMGIDRSSLGRILDMLPQVLTCDPYSDLYPIFDFLLNEVKVPYPNVQKSILRCPTLLICSVEHQLMPALCFLRELGFVGPHKINCHTTLLLVSSVECTLLPKIEFLKGLGFTHKEVSNMVLRSPGLLTFSIGNNLRPKLEYFLKEMNGDVVELKRFPQYFSFSLERKIEPRHRMLIQHGLSLPLDKMLKVSDSEFYARLPEMRLGTLEGRW